MANIAIFHVVMDDISRPRKYREKNSCLKGIVNADRQRNENSIKILKFMEFFFICYFHNAVIKSIARKMYEYKFITENLRSLHFLIYTDVSTRCQNFCMQMSGPG